MINTNLISYIIQNSIICICDRCASASTNGIDMYMKLNDSPIMLVIVLTEHRVISSKLLIMSKTGCDE